MQRLIWLYVYKRLIKCPMFVGRYDHDHCNPHFVHGVSTVMEYIAKYANREEEYEDMWLKNVEISKNMCNKSTVS